MKVVFIHWNIRYIWWPGQGQEQEQIKARSPHLTSCTAVSDNQEKRFKQGKIGN